jgi:hypothetical protein
LDAQVCIVVAFVQGPYWLSVDLEGYRGVLFSLGKGDSGTFSSIELEAKRGGHRAHGVQRPLKELGTRANKGDVFCVGCDLEVSNENRESFVGWSLGAVNEGFGSQVKDDRAEAVALSHTGFGSDRDDVLADHELGYVVHELSDMSSSSLRDGRCLLEWTGAQSESAG